MKKRTTRLILDCMMCDAMSPEFKAANDILLRIIKLNDRTDGIPYPRLVEINKAFKSNDAKAAKVAYDKLAAFIPKGEKTLKDDLEESKSKLAETTKAIDAAKRNLADGKAFSALFDKFVKAIDTAKFNPKTLPKLKPYADKLKPYGDFAKRIELAIQMDKAGKDVAKQCDMLKKAVSDGKTKYAKTLKALSDEFSKAKNRLDVYKEAVKIRTSKIADFAKEKDEVKNLGSELPVSVLSEGKEPKGRKELSPEQQKAMQYVDRTIAKILKDWETEYGAYKAKMTKAGNEIARIYEKAETHMRGLSDSLKKLSRKQELSAVCDFFQQYLGGNAFIGTPGLLHVAKALDALKEDVEALGDPAISVEAKRALTEGKTWLKENELARNIAGDVGIYGIDDSPWHKPSGTETYIYDTLEGRKLKERYSRRFDRAIYKIFDLVPSAKKTILNEINVPIEYIDHPAEYLLDLKSAIMQA